MRVVNRYVKNCKNVDIGNEDEFGNVDKMGSSDFLRGKVRSTTTTRGDTWKGTSDSLERERDISLTLT